MEISDCVCYIKKVRGDITIKILEAAGNTVIAIADLFGVFLSVGYGASLGKFEYELARREGRYAVPEKVAYHRYYSLLHKLQKQGFIERKKRGSNIFIRLTSAGKEKLNLFRIQRKENPPHRSYKLEECERKFVIVAFDIPEKSRRKRDWLRSALTHLGMRMIQKSVWAGKIKLPKEFIDDLEKYIKYILEREGLINE